MAAISFLDAVWNTLPVFYAIMQILLAGSYLTADWTKIGKEIEETARKSIAMTTTEATETTKLLHKELEGQLN